MTDPEAKMMATLSAHLLNLAGAARETGHRAADAGNGCGLCEALAKYEEWLNGKDVR